MERYIPKPYDTPEMLGVKWQMDVKFVPRECFVGEIVYGDEHKYYQYTMIDEATRERFIFPYREHNVQSTVDFVKRAIAYFGYMPLIIQTDNGSEFTNVKKPNQKEPRVHSLDILLNKLHIKHQLIRAYTPRLNGKVERSHRTDQANFYDYLRYKDYNELKRKMLNWLLRYNNMPHSSLTNRAGRRVYWSPLEKRQDLLALLAEELQSKREQCEHKIRFIKNQMTARQVYAVA